MFFYKIENNKLITGSGSEAPNGFTVYKIGEEPEDLLDLLALEKLEYDANQYQRDRAEEYPPVTDYLDGIVKGDTAQVDKYIADCQAVKLKYPKEAE